MIKKSIIYQLFRNTTIIIFIIFFIQFILYLLFFNSFYTYYKVNDLKTDFNQLYVNINDTENDSDVINIINSFSKKTNTYNNILNYNNNNFINNNNLVSIEIETEEEMVNLYTLPLDNQYLQTNNTITALAFKHKTKNLYLPYYLEINNEVIHGNYINKNSIEIAKHMNFNNIYDFDINYLYTINGIIRNVSMPTDNISIENNVIISEIIKLPKYSNNEINKYNINQSLQGNYYISKNENNVNIVFINPIKIDGELYNLYTILTLTSSQEIFKIFLIFNAILSLILLSISTLLAFLNARFTTRPIIALNELTMQGAYLNEKTDLNIECDNEIKSIADSFYKLLDYQEENNRKIEEQNKRLYDLLKSEINNEIIRKNFINNLADELQEPYKNMQEHLKTLMSNSKKEENVLLNELNKEITTTSKIINDFILINELDKTQFKKSFETFDLKILVEDVISSLEDLINNKKMILQLDFTSNIVLGDRNKISIAIGNMLTNALKYAEENNFINISIYEKNQKIIFSIEMVSVFISEEKLNYIYQPYNIIDKIVHKNNDISLLEMYIARLILKQHDAQFGVYNDKNGVKYYLSLNAYVVEENLS